MLSETKTSQAEKVKVVIPPVRIADDDILKLDVSALRESERRLSEHLRHELVEFAAKNRTRRVYVVSVMKLTGTAWSICYMPFSFENRSMAYSMRDSLENASIDIYDFSPIINCEYPLKRDDEKKLWQVFNTCCRCSRPRSCKDVKYCGKSERMCEECIEELTSHLTGKKNSIAHLLIFKIFF